MPVVHEDRMPVLYDDWEHWRRYRGVPDAGDPDGDAVPVAEGPEPLREFCAMCWGQGRFLEPARNGEGYVPQPCGFCGGSGRTPS